MTVTLKLSKSNVELAFHKQPSIDGMTELAKAKELLALFKSISIRSPNLRLRIEWLKKAEDVGNECRLDGELQLELDLRDS